MTAARSVTLEQEQYSFINLLKAAIQLQMGKRIQSLETNDKVNDIIDYVSVNQNNGIYSVTPAKTEGGLAKAVSEWILEHRTTDPDIINLLTASPYDVATDTTDISKIKHYLTQLLNLILQDIRDLYQIALKSVEGENIPITNQIYFDCIKQIILAYNKILTTTLSACYIADEVYKGSTPDLAVQVFLNGMNNVLYTITQNYDFSSDYYQKNGPDLLTKVLDNFKNHVNLCLDLLVCYPKDHDELMLTTSLYETLEATYQQSSMARRSDQQKKPFPYFLPQHKVNDSSQESNQLIYIADYIFYCLNNSIPINGINDKFKNILKLPINSFYHCIEYYFLILPKVKELLDSSNIESNSEDNMIYLSRFIYKSLFDQWDSKINLDEKYKERFFYSFYTVTSKFVMENKDAPEELFLEILKSLGEIQHKHRFSKSSLDFYSARLDLFKNYLQLISINDIDHKNFVKLIKFALSQVSPEFFVKFFEKMDKVDSEKIDKILIPKLENKSLKTIFTYIRVLHENGPLNDNNIIKLLDFFAKTEARYEQALAYFARKNQCKAIAEYLIKKYAKNTTASTNSDKSTDGSPHESSIQSNSSLLSVITQRSIPVGIGLMDYAERSFTGNSDKLTKTNKIISKARLVKKSSRYGFQLFSSRSNLTTEFYKKSINNENNQSVKAY